MAKGFKRSKDKRDGDRYMALPHVVIDSAVYRSLSHPARSLLIDIARQYTGNNNGKLVACAKYLRPLGWKSNDTVTRALMELKDTELLIETRLGMRPNRAAWFALGWYALDPIDGMDLEARHFRRGQYRIAEPTPRAGAKRGKIVPSDGVEPAQATPSGGTVQQGLGKVLHRLAVTI